MSMRILTIAMFVTVTTVAVAEEEEVPQAPAYPLTDIYLAEMEFSEGK